MRYLISSLALVFVAVACTKPAFQSNGSLKVSVGFGDSSNVRGARLALTPNTMLASNLVYETIAVCGGQKEIGISATNPATGIPVCRQNLGDYPKLLKVDVEIAGEGQGTRKYTLDLSQPELMPAELSLERVTENGATTYRLKDRGGNIESAITIISRMLRVSLAVQYVDNHYLETIDYELISDAVVRAKFRDCDTCVVSVSDSTFPQGFSVAGSAAGHIDIDSSLAAAGTHRLVLAVKKNAAASTFTLAAVSFTVVREIPNEHPLTVNFATDEAITSFHKIHSNVLVLPKSAQGLSKVELDSALTASSRVLVTTCNLQNIFGSLREVISVSVGDHSLQSSPGTSVGNLFSPSECVTSHELTAASTTLAQKTEIGGARVSQFVGSGNVLLSVNLRSMFESSEGLSNPQYQWNHAGTVAGTIKVTYTTGSPSSPIRPLYELAFENFLGPMDAEIGLRWNPFGIVTTEDVQILAPTQTPELFSKNASSPSGDSFPTDWLGIWGYYAGTTFRFPTPIKKLSFDIIYCSCATQPSFDVRVGSATLLTFRTPATPGQTANISVDLPSPSTDVTIRYVEGSGSSGMLDLDNLRAEAATP